MNNKNLKKEIEEKIASIKNISSVETSEYDMGMIVAYNHVIDMIDKPETLTDVEQRYLDIQENILSRKGKVLKLKGEDKHKFENEFNRIWQTMGMINWPVRREVFKSVILYFLKWFDDNLKDKTE